MNAINNSDTVKEQYKNSANLNTRISIHSKYSTNKMGFGNWIVSNYEIKKGMRILELGCGTGDMWKEQEELNRHILSHSLLMFISVFQENRLVPHMVWENMIYII